MPLSTPVEDEIYMVETPFRLDHASVVKRLRLPKSDGRHEAMVSELLERSRAIGPT